MRTWLSAEWKNRPNAIRFWNEGEKMHKIQGNCIWLMYSEKFTVDVGQARWSMDSGGRDLNTLLNTNQIT